MEKMNLECICLIVSMQKHQIVDESCCAIVENFMKFWPNLYASFVDESFQLVFLGI
jgi:hypothetical protein